MSELLSLNRWVARPVDPLVVPPAWPAADWLSQALPVLEAVFQRTLASAPVDALDALDALPSPLPALSWAAALGGYSRLRLQSLGALELAEQRIARALLAEFVHLVRLYMRSPGVSAASLFARLLGGPSDARETGTQQAAALGFCDAAHRPDGRAALGVVVKTAAGEVRARMALPAQARDATGAEAAALVAALDCARSLGLSRLALYTDASGLSALLRGRAAPHLQGQALRAQSLSEDFEGLAVYKVPRLFLFEADRLAASALLPASA